MATTPITPSGVTPTPTNTPTAPVTGSTPGLIRTWLLDHERLIIVLIAAVLLWWGYGKYAQIRLDHDNAALQQQKIVVAAQVQQNAALAAQAQKDATQAAEDKAALQVLSDKIAAQNQQLISANTALATALTKQQKTDATLPIPDLVNRWAQLAPGVNFDGTAISNSGNVAVTPSNVRATVQTLEQVPVLKTELANETTQKQNDDQIITTQNKNIFDLGSSINTLNLEVAGKDKLIVDNTKQCTDEKNVMKDEFRKSKRHWFYFGFISGFIARQALKAPTGL